MKDDRGQVTPFVVVFVSVLLLFAGLVVDGGLVLAARLRATDEAQAAARAGAREADLDAYRATGEFTLDAPRATAAAHSYLRTIGQDGEVLVAGDTVTVSIVASQPTQILGIVGISDIRVRGRGVAQAQRGIRTRE